MNGWCVVKLDVYKTDGTLTGEQVELDSSVFEIQPNEHAIWLAVTAELANRRQGTHKTKTRGEVRGGGKKPWRQKGTGRARAGSIRSPLWRGGGRIFGPVPHLYKKQIPQKLRQLARRSALSYLAKENRIRLVEDFSFEMPKTKQMATLLKNLQLAGKKTLLLTAGPDRNVYLSGRNIPFLAVREATAFSTYDVMNTEMLLIQKNALSKIHEVLGS